jgi:hypothetical protein
MLKCHLLVPLTLFLAACAAEVPPERVVEARTSAASAPRGEQRLRRVMLDGHRAARAAVGVAPLIWDDGLAAHARAYADTLARERRFAHADQPMGPAREGENLWTGTRDAYRYEEMLGHWLAERGDFINGPVPAISRTGDWRRAGHYSQIVWRVSTRIGCALSSNRTDDYLVCRYALAGNVVGERAF